MSQYPYGQPPPEQPYGSPQLPPPPGYERPYQPQQPGLPPQNPFGPYGPQQGYQPQPPRRRKHTLRNVLLGTIGGLIAIGIIGAALSGGKGGTGTAPDSGSAPAASAPASSTPASTPAAVAAPAPRVIATFSGSGIENTAKFTVPDSWTLHWSYNCAAFGQAGNFAVLEDGGNDFSGATVNVLGTASHGVTHAYGDAGSHYLEVDSECAWSMQAVG